MCLEVMTNALITNTMLMYYVLTTFFIMADVLTTDVNMAYVLCKYFRIMCLKLLNDALF